MRLRFAIAVGEKTPSLVNLLKRNLACAALKRISTDTLGSINTFVQ
jgi:hypothetical protein